MPSVGFKPTIPKIKRPQTYFSDRSATGIGNEVTRDMSMTDLTKTIRNCRKK